METSAQEQAINELLPNRLIRYEQEQYLSAILRNHPDNIAAKLRQQWYDTAPQVGLAAANTAIRIYTERTKYLLPPDANNEALRDWAQRRADQVKRETQGMKDTGARLEKAKEIAHAHDITPPADGPHRTEQTRLARLLDPKWWRHQGRREHNRRIEKASRAIGLTCERHGLYVSNLSFNRWKARQRAQQAALTLATITNTTTGETLALTDVIARSVSNPEIRRAELMTRISGMEQVAKQAEQQSIFVTMTAPEDMHAVRKATGELLESADDSPLKAHEYLKEQWAKIRATLNRDGHEIYGLRIAEPHHDGTPHWHLIMFGSSGALAAAREIMARFLIEEHHSASRKKHGLKIIKIDPVKGTAAGYVAKYVAKAIDGHKLETATQTTPEGKQEELNNTPDEAAHRVRAWASIWGIRQFQFFGQPPVTIWRQLRRLEQIAEHAAAEALRQVADAGDWQQFVYAMGYAGATPAADVARIFKITTDGINRYGEPKNKYLLQVDDALYDSSPDDWVVDWQGKPTPRTRDNNCNDNGGGAPPTE